MVVLIEWEDLLQVIITMIRDTVWTLAMHLAEIIDDHSIVNYNSSFSSGNGRGGGRAVENGKKKKKKHHLRSMPLYSEALCPHIPLCEEGIQVLCLCNNGQNENRPTLLPFECTYSHLSTLRF